MKATLCLFGTLCITYVLCHPSDSTGPSASYTEYKTVEYSSKVGDGNTGQEGEYYQVLKNEAGDSSAANTGGYSQTVKVVRSKSAKPRIARASSYVTTTQRVEKPKTVTTYIATNKGDFDIASFEKRIDETDEEYYHRILSKEPGESDEHFEEKITLLKQYYPEFKIWENNEYLSYVTEGSYITKRTVTQQPAASTTKRTVTKITKSNSPSLENETVIEIVGPLDRQPGEKQVQYFRRIFQRDTEESDDEFEKRITIIKKYLPDLSVWHNDQYKRYITITSNAKVQPKTISRTVTRSKIHRSSPVPPTEKRTVMKVIGSLEKLPEETESQYYNRIFQRRIDESDEEFEKRVTIIRKFLPKLKVWENDLYKTYVNIVTTSSTQPEEYLQTKTRTLYYGYSPALNEEIETVVKVVGPLKQLPEEDDVDFYTRIFQKQNNEPDSDFEKRITILRKYLPRLSIWRRDLYKCYITNATAIQTKPVIYSEATTRSVTYKDSSATTEEKETVVKVVGPLEKQPEEEEEVYYKRIFKKKPEESDTDYETRVTVIKKYLPELKVWENDVYKSYVTTVEVTKEQPTTESEVTETTKTTVTRSVTQTETPETTEVRFHHHNMTSSHF